MLFARRRAMYAEELAKKKAARDAEVAQEEKTLEPSEDIQKAIDEAGDELPKFEVPKQKKSKGKK